LASLRENGVPVTRVRIRVKVEVKPFQVKAKPFQVKAKPFQVSSRFGLRSSRLRLTVKPFRFGLTMTGTELTLIFFGA